MAQKVQIRDNTLKLYSLHGYSVAPRGFGLHIIPLEKSMFTSKVNWGMCTVTCHRHSPDFQTAGNWDRMVCGPERGKVCNYMGICGSLPSPLTTYYRQRSVTWWKYIDYQTSRSYRHSSPRKKTPCSCEWWEVELLSQNQLVCLSPLCEALYVILNHYYC